MDFVGVLAAAGSSSRFRSKLPKLYQKLAGKLVIERSLDALYQNPNCLAVVVAINPMDSYWGQLKVAMRRGVITVAGGVSRANSVLNALRRASSSFAGKNVLAAVHDAARPCTPPKLVDSMLKALKESTCQGVAPALGCSDAAATFDPKTNRYLTALNRDEVRLLQTPQIFFAEPLQNALEAALARGEDPVDEASCMAAAGQDVLIYPGPKANIKITSSFDLDLARAFLEDQGGQLG